MAQKNVARTNEETKGQLRAHPVEGAAWAKELKSTVNDIEMIPETKFFQRGPLHPFFPYV